MTQVYVPDPGRISKKRTLSQKGFAAIRSFEGWGATPYSDHASPIPNATIGYGHKLHPGLPTQADKERWGTITRAEGDRILRSDVRTFVDAVNSLVKVPLTQTQFDAVVSFAFQLGEGNFMKSDALKDLNAQRFDRVPDDLLHWDVHNPGVQNRHKKEGLLFSSGIYPHG